MQPSNSIQREQEVGCHAGTRGGVIKALDSIQQHYDVFCSASRDSRGGGATSMKDLFDPPYLNPFSTFPDSIILLPQKNPLLNQIDALDKTIKDFHCPGTKLGSTPTNAECLSDSTRAPARIPAIPNALGVSNPYAHGRDNPRHPLAHLTEFELHTLLDLAIDSAAMVRCPGSPRVCLDLGIVFLDDAQVFREGDRQEAQEGEGQGAATTSCPWFFALLCLSVPPRSVLIFLKNDVCSRTSLIILASFVCLRSRRSHTHHLKKEMNTINDISTHNKHKNTETPPNDKKK